LTAQCDAITVKSNPPVPGLVDFERARPAIEGISEHHPCNITPRCRPAAEQSSPDAKSGCRLRRHAWSCSLWQKHVQQSLAPGKVRPLRESHGKR
jgi:hypothetical protein